MKTLPELIIDAVAARLESVSAPEYRNTFAFVEKNTRSSSESDLASGPAVFVCYAGEQMQSFGNSMQVNSLELSIEAHALSETEQRTIGMGLVGDIKKALLADKDYLTNLARREGVVASASEIRVSDQDDTVIASVTLTVPYLERHRDIYFDD